MSFSIRKKMLTALLVIILLFMAVVGFIAIYNQTAYYKSEKMVEAISVEMSKVNNLNQAIKSALMPANDYIITGDRQYEDIFQKQADTIEGFFKDVELFMDFHEKQDFSTSGAVKEEKEILRDIRISWKNIREISLRIFAVPEPAGNAVAARLMEEMDYKWGQPAAIRLARWYEIDMNELKEAVETLKAAWWRSWFIIGAAFVSLTAGGISFAFFYSNRFVRPIKELHNGADRIAGGDLDYRVVIKTGDEIEQLANQFNIMGERVKEFYSVLEEKVRERTEELQSHIDDLERFRTATIGRELRINELKEKNKDLMEKLERLEKES